MNNIEIKKKRFKLLLEGKYIPKDISIQEAKERLKKTDPGIDISNILKIINQEKKDKILKEILIEIITNPDIFVYYMPIIKSILKILLLNERK